MMKCGLLGRHLSHSYSPQIHRMLGDYSYELFEKEPEELEAFLKSDSWDGLNVTVPYKKAVIPFLNQLTPIAQRLGAVNTIIRREGKLIGHNTDYAGFQALLDSLDLSVDSLKVLVLGSGGAASTASAVLTDRGARVVVISRSGGDNYENLHLHQDARLIVNTTPVGMYPDNGASPLPCAAIRQLFPQLEGVVDVIYNPARTKLLLDCEKAGCTVSTNGLLMLVAQAKEAAQWFTGKTISDDVVRQITRKLNEQMQNLILIGMPGCGKTTVGQLLAQRTGRKFVDSDAEICALAGKSIPDIFSHDGHETFRDLETRVLSDLGKQSGLVIATGGGCVTKARNYDLLHQNGIIFRLQRDIEKLPTEGRPLSTDLTQMQRIREPFYDAFQDRIIDNDATPEEAVEQILQFLEV